MIRIGTIDIENFLTVGKASVNFEDRGLIAVLGPNGSGKCLTGDTKISLANGTEVCIKDLVGKKFWVYSYDIKRNRIVAGEAIAEKTLEQADLIEVELDNREKIKCTPEHKFLLKNGTYVFAKDLKIGNGLVPLYRKYRKSINGIKYEQIYQFDTGKYEYTHTCFADVDRKELVHHRNFNPRDNTPKNLIWLTYSEHGKIHIENNPMKDLKIRKKHLEKTRSKEFVEQHRKLAKEKWLDPDYRKNVADGMKKSPPPGFKGPHSEKAKRNQKEKNLGRKPWNIGLTKETDLRIKQISENCKGRISPMKGRNQSAEAKQKNREKHLGRITWNKGLTTKNSEKMREIGKKISFALMKEFNHKVISIHKLDYKEDCYDIYVKDFNNFALSSGIFVHNSSLIVEALIYGLFGITERYGNERDRVINRFVGKDMCIHIPMNIDGVKVEINSYRGHHRFKDEVMLKIDGIDKRGRTNLHTWEKIVKILDMDAIGFQNSIVFGQSVSQYAGLSDAQQKAIVERLLGCSWIPKAYELATTSSLELTKELVLIADRFDVLDGKIEKIKTDIDFYMAKYADFEGERAKKIKEVLAGIQELKSTKALEKEIKEYQDKISTNEILVDGQVQLAVSIRKLDLEINVFEVKNMAVVVEMAKLSKKIANLTETKIKIADDLRCDICGQTITNESVEDFVKHLNSELELKKTETYEYKIKIKARKEERQPFLDEQTNLQKLEQNNRLLVSALNKAKIAISVVDKENARVEERNENCHKRVNEIKKEINTYQDSIDKLKKEMVPLSEEKDKLTVEYKTKKEDLPYSEFIVEFYSNRGFKSYLIESVIPAMNDYAATYSRALGGKFDITFSPQKQLKTKGEVREKFNVEVFNRQGAEVYEGNSNGERRAIDAIVMFVLGDLAANRLNKRVSILILDDVFEKLDDETCNSIIKVLKMMSVPKGTRDEEYQDLPERESIFVLTHLEALKSQFENKMEIRRDHNGNTIIYE